MAELNVKGLNILDLLNVLNLLDVLDGLDILNILVLNTLNIQDIQVVLEVALLNCQRMVGERIVILKMAVLKGFLLE